MPQTLLALLALSLASFLSFNQQRLTSRSHQTMVSSELELAATGLASEVIEMIGARSFDRNSTPASVHSKYGHIPDSPDEFSSPSTFGALGTCDLLRPDVNGSTCNDVDDVHGDQWRPIQVDLAHGRVLDFEVRTRVYYVTSTESMEPSSAPTLHKRVVMDVRTPLVASAPEGILRVTRVLSYDPVKAAMDYENSGLADSGSGTGVAIQN